MITVRLAVSLVCSLLVVALLPSYASRAADSVFLTVPFTLHYASPAAAACFPGVSASGTVIADPQSDTLTVHVAGLPPFVGFELFRTAHSEVPYGTAVPLSLLQADATGNAVASVHASLLQADVAASTRTAATQLVLFFANSTDAASCAALAYAPGLPTFGGQQTGPALMATASSAGSGPLAAAALSRPGLGLNSPSSGSSSAGQEITFTTACSDPAGWKAIRFIDLRLSTGGKIRFVARLDRLLRLLYVFNPETQHWSAGLAPGSQSTLATGLVQLKIVDSRLAATGLTTGKVTWRISFTQAASGLSFQQAVQVTDLRNQSSGWNPTGTWKVD